MHRKTRFSEREATICVNTKCLCKCHQSSLISSREGIKALISFDYHPFVCGSCQ